MSCKHENADHLMSGELSEAGWSHRVLAKCEQFRCLDCGAWLSLGPSVADSPEVQVEIRAAEIAAKVSDAQKTRKRAFLGKPYIGCDGPEIAGWLIAAYDSDKPPEQPGEHAGYLARIIYDHDRICCNDERGEGMGR